MNSTPQKRKRTARLLKKNNGQDGGESSSRVNTNNIKSHCVYGLVSPSSPTPQSTPATPTKSALTVQINRDYIESKRKTPKKSSAHSSASVYRRNEDDETTIDESATLGSTVMRKDELVYIIDCICKAKSRKIKFKRIIDFARHCSDTDFLMLLKSSSDLVAEFLDQIQHESLQFLHPIILLLMRLYVNDAKSGCDLSTFESFWRFHRNCIAYSFRISSYSPDELKQFTNLSNILLPDIQISTSTVEEMAGENIIIVLQYANLTLGNSSITLFLNTFGPFALKSFKNSPIYWRLLQLVLEKAVENELISNFNISAHVEDAVIKQIKLNGSDLNHALKTLSLIVHAFPANVEKILLRSECSNMISNMLDIMENELNQIVKQAQLRKEELDQNNVNITLSILGLLGDFQEKSKGLFGNILLKSNEVDRIVRFYSDLCLIAAKESREVSLLDDILLIKAYLAFVIGKLIVYNSVCIEKCLGKGGMDKLKQSLQCFVHAVPDDDAVFGQLIRAVENLLVDLNKI